MFYSLQPGVFMLVSIAENTDKHSLAGKSSDQSVTPVATVFFYF